MIYKPEKSNLQRKIILFPDQKEFLREEDGSFNKSSLNGILSNSKTKYDEQTRLVKSTVSRKVSAENFNNILKLTSTDIPPLTNLQTNCDNKCKIYKTKKNLKGT